MFGSGQRHQFLSQINNLDSSRILIVAAKHITINENEVYSLISALKTKEIEFYSDFSPD